MRRKKSIYRTFRRTKNRLRILRVIHNWTQDDMARKLGYASKFKYWELENDQRIPTFRERAKLSKIFKVPASDIFPLLVRAA